MSLFRKSPRFVSRFGFVNDGDLESQYMSDFTDDGESQYLPVIEFPKRGIRRPLRSAQEAWNGRTCSSWILAHVRVGFLLGTRLDDFVGDVIVGTESPRAIPCPNWPEMKANDGFNGDVAPLGVTPQQRSDISRAR